jgi:archaellum component FlaC
MAERHDYSEIIAEILIQLQGHGAELKRQSEIQTQILKRLEHSEERMDRSEAGFNNFAIAVLDHLQGIKTELGEVKTEVSSVKTEVRELKAAERLADHEERLRRLEDFMRRAS